MRFGVHLPHLGRQAGRETVRRFAQKAEALGFADGWASDHIAWPAAVESRYPYSEDGEFPAPFDTPWLDPLGTLLFVAGCTERIGLGTTVLILGYRPPVQTAKLLTTLDVLSGGRLILGAGVGWMREEFEALGMPFDHRGARADEQLELFEALFTQPLASYTGRFHRLPEVAFAPKPVNGRIPIWIGGSTEAAFRRCARYGDCLHAAFTPLAELAAHFERTRELAAGYGRDPESIALSVRVFLDFDGLSDPEKSLQGSPDDMLAGIDRFAAAGASHLLLDIVARGGAAGREAAMERFAAEVASKIAG